MARKRMIDPSIWTSESFGSLSNLGKILFIGIISNADDEGRFKGSPTYLKAIILPYGNETTEAISDALEELEQEKIITIYTVEDTLYGVLPKWNLYQTISRPYPSKIPHPPELVINKEVVPEPTNNSGTTQEPFNEHSLNDHEQLNDRSTIKEKKIKQVKTPANKNSLADMKSIAKHYQDQINASSRCTNEARLKIFARLKTYDMKSLVLAIDKFSSDPWWMEHNSGRGISWFFKNDDRIDQFLNLGKSKQESPSSVVGIPNASAYLEDNEREAMYGSQNATSS